MIFVHAHVYKNAGSTLDWSLKESFGDEYMEVRASPGLLWRNPDQFSAIVRENAPLKAVSAHWVNLRDMDKWGFDCFPFIMMRNPLERARSVYNFERKQKENDSEGPTAAKAMSFREYVQWSMSHPVHSVLQNHQTRHCSGKLLAQLTEQDLASATDLLDLIPVTGIVDLYDQTMVLLEERLSQHGIAVDLSYTRQNATQDYRASTPEKVGAVRESLGSLFEELEAANKFDLALYDRSREHLLAQCDEVNNFVAKLASFRQRCVALSERVQSPTPALSPSPSMSAIETPVPAVLKKLWSNAFRSRR